MTKVLTIKNWKRPEMYKTVLDYLSKCEGIEDYIIINSVDYVNSVLANQFMDIDKHNGLIIQTYVSARPLGCAGNTRFSLELGFDMFKNPSINDFVLHLEDDLLPGRDWLKFMEWANRSFFIEEDVFLVTGWHRRSFELTNDEINEMMPLAKRRKTPIKEHLTYQGWGIWRNRWEEFKDDFFGIHWRGAEPAIVHEGEKFLDQINKSDDGSWGWPMKQYWRRGRYEICPLISRIQNIGWENGRFNQSKDWHSKNVFTYTWSDDRVGPYKYELQKEVK